MIEDDEWEDDENQDTEIQEDELDRNNDFHLEGFALALYKIQELIKVWFYVTHNHGFEVL